MIDITGLDKAEVLAALYNKAKPLGLGFLQATSQNMTKEEAQTLISNQGGNLYFDYVKGRPLKVDLSSDKISPNLYDRDQGQGAAETAINSLKSGHIIPSEQIKPQTALDKFAIAFKQGEFGDKDLDEAMSGQGFGFEITPLGKNNDNDTDSE